MTLYVSTSRITLQSFCNRYACVLIVNDDKCHPVRIVIEVPDNATAHEVRKIARETWLRQLRKPSESITSLIRRARVSSNVTYLFKRDVSGRSVAAVAASATAVCPHCRRQIVLPVSSALPQTSITPQDVER